MTAGHLPNRLHFLPHPSDGINQLLILGKFRLQLAYVFVSVVRAVGEHITALHHWVLPQCFLLIKPFLQVILFLQLSTHLCMALAFLKQQLFLYTSRDFLLDLLELVDLIIQVLQVVLRLLLEHLSDRVLMHQDLPSQSDLNVSQVHTTEVTSHDLVVVLLVDQLDHFALVILEREGILDFLSLLGNVLVGDDLLSVDVHELAELLLGHEAV